MDISPRQAGEALRGAATLDNPHDRRVHGMATAATGMVLAAYVVLGRLLEVSPWDDVAVAGYVLVLLALATWQARVARTVPRNARTVGYLGLGGAILVIIPVLGWLNWLDATSVDPGVLVVVGHQLAGRSAPGLSTGAVVATARSAASAGSSHARRRPRAR